jgi:hypothetical protein
MNGEVRVDLRGTGLAVNKVGDIRGYFKNDLDSEIFNDLERSTTYYWIRATPLITPWWREGKTTQISWTQGMTSHDLQKSI